MHRFYCHSSHCRGNECELQGREAAHAFRVLRLVPGDAIGIIDEHGTQFTGTVASATKTCGRVFLHAAQQSSAPDVHITLAQALPKGTGFDSLVDRATQVGVSSIVPLISERTIARPARERWPAKRERWQKKALAAVKQCGRTSMPAIMPMHTFQEVLAHIRRYACTLIGSLEPEAEPLKRALAGPRPSSVLVLIGPEGDFTPREYALAVEAGARQVSLGKRILRCEVAATLVLGIMAYEWDY